MTAYHDLDTPADMRTDAARVGAHLPAATGAPAYTDVYAAWPTDMPKAEVRIDLAAARLAGALGLSLE